MPENISPTLSSRKEKSFLNLDKSNQVWIVNRLFLSILYETEFRLVLQINLKNVITTQIWLVNVDVRLDAPLWFSIQFQFFFAILTSSILVRDMIIILGGRWTTQPTHNVIR